MKFKKVLSLALGAIMALSVSVTALAADTTQYYGVFYKDGSTDVSMTTNALGQYNGKTITVDEVNGIITMPVYSFDITVPVLGTYTGYLTSITDVDAEGEDDGIDITFANNVITVTFAEDAAYSIDELLDGTHVVDCTISYNTGMFNHVSTSDVDFGLTTNIPHFINPMG